MDSRIRAAADAYAAELKRREERARRKSDDRESTQVRPDANYRRASVAGRVVPAIFILVLSACGTGALPSDESEDGSTPATVEIRRQQFDSDAVTIEALVAGNDGADDVIVLLAGRGCGAMCFIDFLPLLADAGFRAIALNPRGADGSRGSLDNLTLHDFAADVARVIERMGVGPVHVLGHGFGNRVARCVASDRPELVAGLVLLGAGGQVKGDVEALEALERLYVPELSQDQTLAALQTALFAPGSTPRSGPTCRSFRSWPARRIPPTAIPPGKTGSREA